MRYALYPEPRLITERECGERRAQWYADQEIAYWRAKRRKTYKLLVAARKHVKLLRSQININSNST
jgi:hypothetical protein